MNRAEKRYQQKLIKNLDRAMQHFNAGRLPQAKNIYQQIRQSNPSHPVALHMLGFIAHKMGKTDIVVDLISQAVAIAPDYIDAHNNLGNALMDTGRLDEAVASYRKALTLDPKFTDAHTNLLFSAQHQKDITLKSLNDMHADWDESFAYPLRKEWSEHKNQRDLEKRLRIGFVSPDFGFHPVGYLLVGLLENKLQDEVEFICYSDRKPDEMTERLKQAADGWIDIYGMVDETLIERLRSDGIDILFDLTGHTSKNRLLVFAHKPAPVQVSWGVGYPGTTGLKAIDYLLADIYHVPKSEDHLYSEQIIRLPDSMFCYNPPHVSPTVGPLPAEQNGFITFGSFNRPAKISDDVMAVWIKILEAVPGSRLLLKYSGIGDHSARRRLFPLLEAHGLDTSRLMLEGKSPHQDLLARYNEIDIALDTFPYSGGLTTCEALWMGVPVITLSGKTPAGRHALSYISTVGLSKFVARDVSHYINLAVELAKAPSQIADLRSELRRRFTNSPLCDGPRFARHFADEMRKVWHVWCQGGAS